MAEPGPDPVSRGWSKGRGKGFGEEAAAPLLNALSQDQANPARARFGLNKRVGIRVARVSLSLGPASQPHLTPTLLLSFCAKEKQEARSGGGGDL
jgi:hypothetical protein